MVVVVLCCACGVDFYWQNALGPNSNGVAVSPYRCQSLRVTWTHRAPTPPLTLNHYRVRYRAQGGSLQTGTTTSQGSYTLTGLAPATTYTVRVHAQTQLGYGFASCLPIATTHNGKAHSDACMGSQVIATPYYVLCHCHSYWCTARCHVSWYTVNSASLAWVLLSMDY